MYQGAVLFLSGAKTVLQECRRSLHSLIPSSCSYIPRASLFKGTRVGTGRGGGFTTFHHQAVFGATKEDFVESRASELLYLMLTEESYHANAQ